MFGTVLWLAGSYSFYRYMMKQCRKAAQEGYQSQLQYLRSRRGV